MFRQENTGFLGTGTMLDALKSEGTTDRLREDVSEHLTARPEGPAKDVADPLLSSGHIADAVLSTLNWAKKLLSLSGSDGVGWAVSLFCVLHSTSAIR